MACKFISGIAIVCLAVVTATPTIASVVYSYEGNNFDTFSFPSSYNAAMSVSGSLTLASPLGMYFGGTVTPLSFTFSDGINTFTESNTDYSGFRFNTDATGAITQWAIEMYIDVPDPVKIGDTFFYLMSQNVVDMGSMETCISISYTGSCSIGIDNGVIEPANVSGWSVVPVPPAVWLFGSGLIGLIGIARRKKS